MRILSKLDKLITGQKQLETRISNIEKSINNNNSNNNSNNTNDPDFVKVI
jgi:hypothetical protein